MPESELFSVGVKTTYCKFSAAAMVIIQEIMAGRPEDGFKLLEAEVMTYPAATETRPAGFSILTALPPSNATFEPDPFIAGSRAVLDACTAKAKKTFRCYPDTVAAWDQFAALVPSSDCALAYCREHGLNIPLKVCIYTR